MQVYANGNGYQINNGPQTEDVHIMEKEEQQKTKVHQASSDNLHTKAAAYDKLNFQLFGY